MSQTKTTTTDVTEDWLTDQAVSLPVALWDAWEAAKAQHKAAKDVSDTLETHVKTAKAAIVEALQGAVAGDFGNGQGVTNKLVHKDAYAVKASDTCVLRAVKTKEK